MGGGSGPSGQVEYPNYIENMQSIIMTNRMHWHYEDTQFYEDGTAIWRDFHRHPPHSWEDFVDNWTSVAAEGSADTANTQGLMFAIDAMIGANPFQSGGNPVVSYNPNTRAELTRVENSIMSLDVEIDGMDTFIQDELNAFEDEAKLQHYRSMAVMAGSFRDVNSVVSTSFLQGVTYQQINYDNKLARARGDAFKTRAVLMERRANLQMEASKLQIIARVDQNEKDTALSVDDQSWEFNTLLRGLTGIGAISGVATGSSTQGSKPSSASRALGGAASGAALGTAILPGYGTAIGAVVGGVAGIFA